MTNSQDASRSTPPSTAPGQRVSTAVVEAIAAEADRDPTELPPLFDTIDPDALDAIFSTQPDGTPRRDGEVVFPYAGYRVCVSADRTVEVRSDPDHA